MQNTLENQKAERGLSNQMKAVLTIFSADPELMDGVRPYVDFDLETVQWEPIFKTDWSAAHRVAVDFAHSIWKNDPCLEANPFEAVLTIGPRVQAAILKALTMRRKSHSEVEEIEEKPYNQGGTL